MVRPDAPYLAADSVVDWHHPAVEALAQTLHVSGDPLATVRRCFNHVAWRIAHSNDAQRDEVSCHASEVLALGHGLCYAKAHLFAALLRANGIPAGFDYQRLSDEAGGYVLHGLNTVWLDGVGWWRVDARGGPLAAGRRWRVGEAFYVFPVGQPGEVNYGVNLAAPPRPLVEQLERAHSLRRLWPSLPQGL